jgi:hypothetical protein
MSIQSRIEELAVELKVSTGKRPHRVLCSDETFRQWLREMKAGLPVDLPIEDFQMSSVKTHAAGHQLDFAASDRELEVE